jgi:dTDP-4-amino-4,6-dideoxygalactose transaminase
MRAKRAAIAQKYDEAFGGIPALETPTLRLDRQSALHLYILRLHTERLTITRNEFISALKDRDIGTSVHFIPLHMHPYYRDTYGYVRSDFPAAAGEYERYFSLPLFPDMTGEQVDYVIECVCKIAEANSK